VSRAFAPSARESTFGEPVVVRSWLAKHAPEVSRSKKHAPGVTVAVALLVGVLVMVGVDVTVCASTFAAAI